MEKLGRLALRVRVLRAVTHLRELFSRFGSSDISLIEDEALTKILKEGGNWDKLLAGELRCCRCETVLTEENLAGFVVCDGTYRLLCDSQVCLGLATNL